jgi:iron complex transport system substrate-binding protein
VQLTFLAPARLRAALVVSCLVSTVLSAAPVTRELVDATGSRVRVPIRPERIVSLAPDLTQLLFHLDAGPSVVAISNDCDRPPAAVGLPRVGPIGQPSIEAILAVEPDLVLATAQANPLKTVERLRELGVAVVGLNARGRGLAGVFEQVERVADAVGRPERGRAVARSLRERIEALAAEGGDLPSVRACALVWTEPLIAAGAGSFLADMLAAAGATPGCTSTGEEYPRLSREDLLLEDPDVLFVVTGVPESMASFDAPWAVTLRAVRTGWLRELEPDLFLRPGVELVDAAEVLRDTLLPLRRGRPTEGP